MDDKSKITNFELFSNEIAEDVIKNTNKTLNELINQQHLSIKQAKQLEEVLRSNLATLLEKEHPHC